MSLRLPSMRVAGSAITPQPAQVNLPTANIRPRDAPRTTLTSPSLLQLPSTIPAPQAKPHGDSELKETEPTASAAPVPTAADGSGLRMAVDRSHSQGNMASEVLGALERDIQHQRDTFAKCQQELADVRYLTERSDQEVVAMKMQYEARMESLAAVRVRHAERCAQQRQLVQSAKAIEGKEQDRLDKLLAELPRVRAVVRAKWYQINTLELDRQRLDQRQSIEEFKTAEWLDQSVASEAEEERKRRDQLNETRKSKVKSRLTKDKHSILTAETADIEALVAALTASPHHPQASQPSQSQPWCATERPLSQSQSVTETLGESSQTMPVQLDTHPSSVIDRIARDTLFFSEAWVSDAKKLAEWFESEKCLRCTGLTPAHTDMDNGSGNDEDMVSVRLGNKRSAAAATRARSTADYDCISDDDDDSHRFQLRLGGDRGYDSQSQSSQDSQDMSWIVDPGQERKQDSESIHSHFDVEDGPATNSP